MENRGGSFVKDVPVCEIAITRSAIFFSSKCTIMRLAAGYCPDPGGRKRAREGGFEPIWSDRKQWGDASADRSKSQMFDPRYRNQVMCLRGLVLVLEVFVLGPKPCSCPWPRDKSSAIIPRTLINSIY